MLVIKTIIQKYLECHLPGALANLKLEHFHISCIMQDSLQRPSVSTVGGKKKEGVGEDSL